jgi:hypothetical protein
MLEPIQRPHFGNADVKDEENLPRVLVAAPSQNVPSNWA